jgi:hypothetical protein
LSTLSEGLRGQYTRIFEMLRDATRAFDDEQWAAGEGLLVPWRIALHAVDTIDFYLHDEPDHGVFGRFGCLWKGESDETRPSQAQLLAYVDEIEARGRAWLAAKGDADLLAPTGFPWTGDSRLEQLIYSLRHSQQHVGELNAILRARDLPRIPWD